MTNPCLRTSGSFVFCREAKPWMYLVPLALPNSSQQFNLGAFQEVPLNPDSDKEKEKKKKKKNPCNVAQCDGAGKP